MEYEKIILEWSPVDYKVYGKSLALTGMRECIGTLDPSHIKKESLPHPPETCDHDYADGKCVKCGEVD